MKNLLKKSAVATAVAGSLMISSVASADSVLAPLVIGVQDGAQTYFSIKVRGSGKADARWGTSSDLHYNWYQKGTSVADLYDLNKTCEISDNKGTVSPWDMVFQRAVDNDKNALNLLSSDKSIPNGYTNSNFVGFAIIGDSANANTDPAVKNLANEGEISGFGYVVDAANSFVLDYKLLNNHRSKVETDFSAGFISKKSIDYSWMPVNIATTEWLSVVTSESMTKQESGAGVYDATVYISQDQVAGSVSPRDPFGQSGVYNNDEVVTSGTKVFKVTCMGAYGRGTFLNGLQASDTVNGGWKRMSIQNASTTGSGATTRYVASGAITYKAELVDFAPTTRGGAVVPEQLVSGAFAAPGGVFGVNTAAALDGLIERSISDNGFDVSAPSPINNRGVVSFQVETSGHLSSTPEPHPNRPY
ncbi:hypothetical protein [uncultured Thiothrix sp.]|uniref:hypothetical protein n=1 Tax=uncultured Thiothrix sp. TaxID=223185 RepID=UPI002610AB49|nr:hypothetical protein [uncultured Thiothrix sp.]HMT92594.1 hypothetical protein [Thiolinea sp.]